jgi:hypothetical protein
MRCGADFGLKSLLTLYNLGRRGDPTSKEALAMIDGNTREPLPGCIRKSLVSKRYSMWYSLSISQTL